MPSPPAPPADRAGAFPAQPPRHAGPGERAAVRRAVQPAALLGPVAALHGGRRPAPSSGPSARRWASPPIPGGFPLYKNGVLVGGVGVMADGDYGFDPDISDVDNDDEENIALAATTGFAAPATITADKISSTAPRCATATRPPPTLKSSPASAPAFATAGRVGNLDGGDRLFRRRRDLGRPGLWHRSLGHPHGDHARSSPIPTPSS